MQKGKYGIYLWFYAVVAFILAFLGETLLCGLLLGFVIIAEKDEWLSKQVIQAFFLSLFSSTVSYVLSNINIFQSVPLIGGVFTGICNVINFFVSIAILIFAIIAIVKTAKGQDAGVPGFSALANRAYGYVAKKVYTNPNQGNNTNAQM